MFQARFSIMARTTAGEVFEAFRWTRDAASGIARAWREAPSFGFDLAEVWAEPIAEKFRTKDREAETNYMRARWHKNGSIHLWFLRDDLREKANRLIAEHFGEALGARPRARRA